MLGRGVSGGEKSARVVSSCSCAPRQLNESVYQWRHIIIMMTTTVYTCAWQHHLDGDFVTQDDMGVIWALRNDAVIGSHKLEVA